MRKLSAVSTTLDCPPDSEGTQTRLLPHLIEVRMGYEPYGLGEGLWHGAGDAEGGHCGRAATGNPPYIDEVYERSLADKLCSWN